MKLPPLPIPDIHTAMVRPENEPRRLWGAYFTCDQMLAYGAACRAAALEEAAKVCEEMTCMNGGQFAAAIRALNV